MHRYRHFSSLTGIRGEVRHDSLMKTRFLHAPALASILWSSTLQLRTGPDRHLAHRRGQGDGANDGLRRRPLRHHRLAQRAERFDIRKTEDQCRYVDAGKRNRPIIGMQILMELRPQGNNKWSGQIYNPEDGKTYDANVVLENGNVLKVQGCVLSSVRRGPGRAKG